MKVWREPQEAESDRGKKLSLSTKVFWRGITISLVLSATMLATGSGCFYQQMKGETPPPPAVTFPPTPPAVLPPPPPPAAVLPPPPPAVATQRPPDKPKKHPYLKCLEPVSKKEASESSNAEKAKDYQAVLRASSPLRLNGSPGILTVCIGIPPNCELDRPEKTVQGSCMIPAVGVTAKIVPVAPAFDVKRIEPAESQCIKIDSTGSTVSFSLTPKSEGNHSVGADIYLYDSGDCSSTPIPKTARSIEVEVLVKGPPWTEIVKAMWKMLADLWTGILGIFSAAILFLIRKKLKKWFDFGE